MEKFRIIDDGGTKGYIIMEADGDLCEADVLVLTNAGFELIYIECLNPARFIVKKIRH